MFSLIAFLITFVSSLRSIKPLPNEFVLVKDERYTLNFDDYLFGDSLQFEINTEQNLEILVSYSSINQSVFQTGLNITSPSKISSFLILKGYLVNEFLIYASSENLYIFELDLIKPRLGGIYNLASGNILQIQIIDCWKENKTSINRILTTYILILSESFKLSYIQVNYNESYIYWNSTKEIQADLPNRNVVMTQGIIDELLLITGWEENEGFAYFYDVSNISDIKLHKKFFLVKSTDGNFPEMLSLSIKNTYFVIVPTTSQMFRFETNYLLDIVDVLFLPQFSQNVSSINISYDNSVFVGFKGGFALISLDFSEIYINSDFEKFDKVYVSSTSEENLILAGTDSNYTLFRLGKYYNIVGNISLVIKEKTFMWICTSFFWHTYFISGLNDRLYYSDIIYNSTKLLITSSESEKSYILKVTQNEPYSVFYHNFTVKRPYNNLSGYIELVSDHLVIAEFKEFKSNVLVPLKEYLIGENLTVIYANSSLNEPENHYFKITLESTGNLKKSREILGSFSNYTKIKSLLFPDNTYSAEIIFLYSSNILSIYLNSINNYTNTFSDIIIKEILFCGNLFVMYVEKTEKNEFQLMIFNFYFWKNSIKNISLIEQCKTFLCSPLFIICQQEIFTIIIDLDISYSFNRSALSNSYFNNNITSMTINSYSLLMVIYEGYYLSLLFIPFLVYTNVDNPTIDIQLNYLATRIYCTNFNIIIEDTNNLLHIIDTSLTSRKMYKILKLSNIQTANHFLISETFGAFQIIDTSQLVTNSTISSVSLPNPVDFSSVFYSDTLNLYVLYEDSIVVYQLPSNYDNLNISITIQNLTSIDKIDYIANIDLEVANNFSTQCFLIPVLLYVNGETIFKNQTSIDRVQHEEMNYQCGEYREIPIDQLFLGQGLDVKISNPSKFVRLKERFNEKSELPFIDFDQVVYSQAFEVYVVNVKCNVTVFSDSLEKVSQTFIANIYEEFCMCNSIRIINEDEFLSFVLGCYIESLIFKGVDSIKYFENNLVFGRFSEKNVSIDQILKVPYWVGNIKTTAKVSGNFLLICTERFEVFDKNKFYSNHLIVVEGFADEQKTTAQIVDCDFGGIFGLNYYYLTDVEVTYDPMFNISYIYSLDFNFGLRIFSYSSGLCNAESVIQFNESHTGYSLSLCGNFLHVVTQDTDILIYSIQNRSQPFFLRKIQTFTELFKAVQGSMRCSSNSYPEYLLFQMITSENLTYLHLVDTQSNSMASTLKNYEICQSSSSLPLVSSEFLNDSKSLMIITSQFSKHFTINSFKLVINTGNDCHKSFTGNFSIDVSNANKRNDSTSFKIKVVVYSQGSFSSSSMNLWEMLLICIGTLLFSLILFVLVRKKILRSRSKKTKVLFSYEKDYFQEGAKLNKSFD